MQFGPAMRAAVRGLSRRVRVAAIPAAAVLSLLTVVSACSSGVRELSSPLNGAGVLTCTGTSRGCAAPGTVRWSRPVRGPYSAAVGVTGELDMAAEAGSSFEAGPPGGAHSVAFAGGTAVACVAGTDEGIDLATGSIRWQRRFAVPSADSAPCDLTVVAPGTVAAANDVSAWVLNAATGAVSSRLAFPAAPQNEYPYAEVLALAHGVLTVQEDTHVYGVHEVYGLDLATGKVRWRVRLGPSMGQAVVGHILYADNLNGNTTTAHASTTAIRRVDLADGAVLPPLALDSRLRGTIASVVPAARAVTAAGGPMSVLLVQVQARDTAVAGKPNMVAGVDPATGRTLWEYPGDTERVDAAAVPPAAAILQAPADAPGSGRWKLRVVDLSTGRLAANLTLGRSVTGRLDTGLGDLGIITSDIGESAWNFYDSAFVAEAPATKDQAGSQAGLYGRLEGLAPASGRTHWHGPWSSSDVWVLGDSPASPHVIIVESCAPAGLAHPTPANPPADSTPCTRGRLYAVNT